LPLPDEVFVPLQQHIGAPCIPVVSKGEQVKTGQCIGKSAEFISSPVHAPVTGKVKAIEPFPHPLGGPAAMVHIVRTGEDEWEYLPHTGTWQALSVSNLRQTIRDAGIVGLGGAAFPTHIKLAPPEDKPIDAFILNGCECEPYLTADHRAMVEHWQKILSGMAIIMKVLGVDKGYIGIEDNKPDAIDRMDRAVQERDLKYTVVPLKTKYPQGAENMLIQAILNRRVPSGRLPMDIGVVVHNVGTALAVAEAIIEGKPLIQRIVTVTGDGVSVPGNVLARIGAPIRQLIAYCGGLKADTRQVFLGGPMMGMAQYDLNVPVLKSTSGIICISGGKIKSIRTYPCIRCGTCVNACPVYLLPTEIARSVEMKQWERVDRLGIDSCIECGSCAFVCPSRIPLVQWIRVGKQGLRARAIQPAA